MKGLVKREIEKSMNFKIDEDQYFGFQKDNEDGGAYDYGRRTLKGPYEDELRRSIPFKRFELFRLSSY